MRGPIAGARLRLPIRLKLAAVSGGLTFAILLAFALVVGGFTERKLQSSFDSELRATAADLQSQFQVNGVGSQIDPELFRVTAAGGSVLRVWDRVNNRVAELDNSPKLGPVYEGIRDVGRYRVIGRPLFTRSLETGSSFDSTPRALDGAAAAIQYGKPTDNLNATIGRVRFFLLLGVLIGTIFAFLAGFFVARRAMRPISGLTKVAREVARTRDPEHTELPRPVANDEIAELSTTLSEMLAELGAARSETEATLDRQRQFVADASHELRTPLTSILANLELLQEDLDRPGGPRDRAGAAEIADSALRSSQRMRRLVGDLLLLARADAGRRAQPRPIDLAVVVREAAREATAVGGEHPLTLDLPPDGEAIVAGARDDLHRLTLNLIENAFLHTPSGTPVVASVQRDPSGGTGGARIRLEVADRGPGVPADQRERIFERFARTEGDRSAVRGTGLGLAIVRAVAEAHGGSAIVRDADGGGALFEIDLPAALRSAPDRVRGPDQRQPSQSRQGSRPTVKRIALHRPSPALVVACTALFVALGGVSYGVATGSIDSREITDNTIRSKDVRNNSVYGRDLRNNDVRDIDIRNGTIKSRDVARGTLTGDNINLSKLGQVPDAAALGGVAAAEYARSAEPVSPVGAAGKPPFGAGFAASGGADLRPATGGPSASSGCRARSPAGPGSPSPSGRLPPRRHRPLRRHRRRGGRRRRRASRRRLARRHLLPSGALSGGAQTDRSYYRVAQLAGARSGEHRSHGFRPRRRRAAPSGGA